MSHINNNIQTQSKFCQKKKKNRKILENENQKRRKTTFHWSNICGLSKQPIDLRI